MKKETLKVVKAAARKLQPVPPPRQHKDKKKYHRHDKHRTVHRNDAGLFFGRGSGADRAGRGLLARLDRRTLPLSRP